MACAKRSDREEIIAVLEKMSCENRKGAKNPSTDAANTFAPDFRQQNGPRVRAVQESFNLKLKGLPRTRGEAARKPLDDKQDKGGGTTESSPQNMGKEFHHNFDAEIKSGTPGELLKWIKGKFGCDFIKAEILISGYSAKGKTQMDFWSGKIDAVAIREFEKDVCEVFIVEWKTSSVDTEIWWENASYFRIPLYQTLVYRELMQAHFKRNDVNAKVGIILVPIHQKYPDLMYPGLCLDFQIMEDNHLFDELKNVKWHTDVDESRDVHAIKRPCKLFKDSLDMADYVDESANNLKDDTPLKDILSDNATVRDLCELLELPFIKVESIKKEEKTNEEHEKDIVCPCNNTCCHKDGPKKKGCPCKTAVQYCTDACSCNKPGKQCKNRQEIIQTPNEEN